MAGGSEGLGGGGDPLGVVGLGVVGHGFGIQGGGPEVLEIFGNRQVGWELRRGRERSGCGTSIGSSMSEKKADRSEEGL